MLLHMRRTLILEDTIFEKAKRRAFKTGTSLSKLTSLALNSLLMNEVSQVNKKKKQIMISTYGEPGVKRDFSVQELAALRDEGR